MTIQELREKRAKAWDEAKKFLDSKRNDSGLLSAEDSKTYDAMEAQIVAYGKEIDRLERQEKLNAELGKPTSEPILNNPNTKIGRASDEYKNAMLTALRTNFKQISNVLQEGVDSDGGVCYLYIIKDMKKLEKIEKK
ncbi:MAG: phage major capsid protein [Ruminococcus sp.]|nr:phage major capsid protein [Ruminococcus sp.]